eukprot:364194-Chlamydomonas_euryale.AAC.5
MPPPCSRVPTLPTFRPATPRRHARRRPARARCVACVATPSCRCGLPHLSSRALRAPQARPPLCRSAPLCQRRPRHRHPNV